MNRFCLPIALLLAASAARAQLCDAPASPLSPSRDLYCLELVPVPTMPRASGRVELGRIPGPFTVAVTAEGQLRYAPTISLAGLPEPSALGPYITYVAWVATPMMYPVTKLGVVTNGRTRLPEIHLDKFIILVTAETGSDVSQPSHQLVLRGGSPSTRLQPAELMRLAIGASRDSAAHLRGASGHAHEHGTSTAVDSEARWTDVPMVTGLTMLPAEMALRPSVAPYLPRALGQLPDARRREIVRLETGDTLHLSAGVVRRHMKGRPLTVYGFNGQYPGPLIWVRQGAEIVVDFANALDQPTTVHWHGVRLDNHFDGVSGLTQAPVPPGGRFTYRVRFPDSGIYWYHPHVREDVQQDLGLYGNIMVRSPRVDWYSPAHREEVLVLDDLLIGDDGLVPYGSDAATHAFMGRFGNVFLVNGEPRYALTVRAGEVVRFFLTNASNTRTFNVSFPGARMKVVGSDVGNFEREEWVESVVIAPAERYVVQVRFDTPGEVALLNRVQGLDHFFGRFFYMTDTLGVVRMRREAARPDFAARFAELRVDTAATTEIERLRRDVDRPADKTLVLALETHDLPFVTRLLMQLDSTYFTPVEWIGTMPSMNWASTTRQVRWVLRDADTGKENMDIAWMFDRGSVIKLRLVNERRAFHAMQHPIHLHGQRFLVLAVNGVPNTNLVWKDTVLVPVGSTVDLLLDLSNPGQWMLHCHIAEHLEAEMMTVVTVK
jgi:FtsP/CotA-like multicopper oxidase with cupredoxin domain